MAKRKRERRVHSPSSISLAKQCHRAWWHRYRDKLKPPELTWAQVCRQLKRMMRTGARIPQSFWGARSKALGKEVHRLAEIYLAVPPARVARARKGDKYYIDWHDLPGQCLAELVRHLPPAGSVSKRNLERRVTVEVNGVKFQGLIDLVGAAAGAVVESYDHKTSGDIRAYALLPHAVAERTHQPERSLKNDLQACIYVLARARESEPPAVGGLCRWNYTETKRSRRSLPVVQYIPTEHARSIAESAASVAKQVESFETIEDATPNTLACDDYGGCWYRAEGHCKVRRRWGLIFMKAERDQRAGKDGDMGDNKLTLNEVRKATAKANEDAEREARKAKKLAAKAAEADEDDDSEDDEDEAPESEPAPKAKSEKRKAPKPVEAEDEDDAEESDDDSEDEDEAPESEPAPKSEPKARSEKRKARAEAAPSPRAAAQTAFDAATSAPDHIIQFFAPDAYAKGEARIIATAYAELAAATADLPRNPERAQALRNLLIARDHAVRALTGEG